MASRKPYEFYVCQRNGFNGVMVYLAGKDENNKTVYLEEDGTPHLHKTNKQGSSTVVTTNSTLSTGPTTTSLKIINAKLDRIITLLESQHK